MGVSDPIVRLHEVGKVFAGGTVALEGLDLTVEAGEFLSLLGPSGCGKSTALRIVAGLAPPTSGRIDWPGRAPTPAGEAPIGFVFQEPTLMPWTTVEGNVAMPLRLLGLPRGEIRARVAETVALVGLGGFEDAVPRELSGGMKMRVSIARALATRPRLLLMDEPFAALDEITRLRLDQDLLSLWQRQRFTVVFVTHSVYESVFLSSRIAVMSPRPGRVVAEVAVGAPYPRDEHFRTSAEYGGICRAVSAHLAAAMAGR